MNRWPITRIFLRGMELSNDGYVGKAVALSGPYSVPNRIYQVRMYAETSARITFGRYDWDKETMT